jgi:hypothetical protein
MSDSSAPSELSEMSEMSASSDSQAPSDLSEMSEMSASSDSQAPSDLSEMSEMSASSDASAPSDLSECLEESCQPFVPCDSTKDCPGDEICWLEMGQCVGCLEEADCGDVELCGPDHQCHAFVPCDSDKQCTPDGMVCDIEAGMCVQCLEHADCPDDHHCVDAQCVPDVCAPEGLLCQDNQVVECNEVGDGLVVVQVCGEKQSCAGFWPEAACLDWLCTPGPAYCLDSAEAWIQCSPDGLQVTEQNDCAVEGAMCVDGTCKAKICELGTIACDQDGVTKLVCGEKGTAFLPEPCPEGSYCLANVELATANCVGQVCQPGEPVCVLGTFLTTCNANGSDVLPGGLDCTAQGMQCHNGACVECATAEKCDGLDNTCDNMVDENPSDCPTPSICHFGKCYSNPDPANCTIHLYSGHVYAVCKNASLLWGEAQAACQKWAGATLIVVNNLQEQQFLSSLTTQPAWIGLTDAAEEKKWVWSACCSDFLYFCNGQPDNWTGQHANGEDCVGANFQMFGEKSGCWNDYTCEVSKLTQYACEVQ